jgi:hypothetical protein
MHMSSVPRVESKWAPQGATVAPGGWCCCCHCHSCCCCSCCSCLSSEGLCMTVEDEL